MAVTVEVKENQTAHIIGPARLTVVIDHEEMIHISEAEVEPGPELASVQSRAQPSARKR